MAPQMLIQPQSIPHTTRLQNPRSIAHQSGKGNNTAVDKNKLFAFGKHKNLVATGGELQIVGNAEDPQFLSCRRTQFWI